MQRARNRSGRKRQRVDVLAHLFQAFFVGYTEPLFFVDDQDAEVLKFYVLREKAMRADNDVHFSGFKIG